MKVNQKVEYKRKNLGMFEEPDEKSYQELTKKRIGFFQGYSEEIQNQNGTDIKVKVALIQNEETSEIEKIEPENITLLD